MAFTLRLSEELHGRLVEAAHASRRSLHAEVLVRLEGSLESEDDPVEGLRDALAYRHLVLKGEKCPRVGSHRPGVFCKACGVTG